MRNLQSVKWKSRDPGSTKQYLTQQFSCTNLMGNALKCDVWASLHICVNFIFFLGEIGQIEEILVKFCVLLARALSIFSSLMHALPTYWPQIRKTIPFANNKSKKHSKWICVMNSLALWLIYSSPHSDINEFSCVSSLEFPLMPSTVPQKYKANASSNPKSPNLHYKAIFTSFLILYLMREHPSCYTCNIFTVAEDNMYMIHTTIIRYSNKKDKDTKKRQGHKLNFYSWFYPLLENSSAVNELLLETFHTDVDEYRSLHSLSTPLGMAKPAQCTNCSSNHLHCEVMVPRLAILRNS